MKHLRRLRGALLFATLTLLLAACGQDFLSRVFDSNQTPSYDDSFGTRSLSEGDPDDKSHYYRHILTTVTGVRK